ncbi:hypothetical protein [Terriglobus roseus]|nr:hypothetical protein [Terriglobus roseus]
MLHQYIFGRIKSPSPHMHGTMQQGRWPSTFQRMIGHPRYGSVSNQTR